MKTKLMTILSLCATALTPMALPTAAMAAVPVPIDDLTAICVQTTVINPDPNSTFRVELNTATIQTSVGAEYEKSRVTTLDIPGGVLIGSVGPTYVPNSQSRNGQSPNIFGTFKTIQTFTGGSKVQTVTYAQDTTFTYGCRVFKINKQGKETEPPGLQVEGLTAVRTEITRTAEVSVIKPNVEVVQLSGGVICNSPLKNPGVWRNQNGYTGECSTRLFLTLGPLTIPSNSLPSLEPIMLPGDHNSPSNATNSDPATVTDEWTADDAV